MDRARAALRPALLLLSVAVCARSALANDGITTRRVLIGFRRVIGPDTWADVVHAAGGDVSHS